MFNFPWTNFHELNLDWILSVVKEAKEIFDNGRSDIDYAVDTADEAKTIATQAAEATIADNSISTVKIQNGAVTNAKLANNSVTTNNIVDRTIIGNDIAENTIESYNIKNGTIIGADISNNTIEASNLASGCVTEEKIVNGSVVASKLGTQLYNYIYREWQATGFNPSQESIANIIATAGDIIVRCFIPSVNFDCFVAVPPITLRNMSGTHIICAGGYYGDPTATLEIRLNASSTNISLNKCSLNGTDTAADIQLIFK